MKKYLITLSIAIFLIAGLGAGGAVYINSLNSDHEATLAKYNSKLMEAKVDLGKANTKFGKADKHIKDLEKALVGEIQNSGEHIIAYGKLLAKYKQAVKGKGTVVVVNTDPETGKEIQHIVSTYEDFRINIKHTLDQKSEVAFNSVFEYDLHMDLGAQLVQTTTKSGAVNHYIDLYEVGPDGQRVGNIELESFDVIYEDQRKAKFHIVPHLALSIGVNGGWTKENGPFISPSASLEASFFGYGLTENDLEWRFAAIGVDILNEGLGLYLAPVQYNIGKPLPFISNMWIGPKIGAGFPAPYTSGYIGVGIGLVM